MTNLPILVLIIAFAAITLADFFILMRLAISLGRKIGKESWSKSDKRLIWLAVGFSLTSFLILAEIVLQFT